MNRRMTASRIRSTGVAVLLALGLVGCGPSVKVNYNYDPDVDFFEIGSFTWGGIQSNHMLPRFDVRRMEIALQQELSVRGFQQKLSGDVLAVAYLGVMPGRTDTLEYSHGLYWTETTKTIHLGTLVLDIIDARTNRLIWRAVAQGKVQEDISPEKRERNIQRIARKVVSEFPPPERR